MTRTSSSTAAPHAPATAAQKWWSPSNFFACLGLVLGVMALGSALLPIVGFLLSVVPGTAAILFCGIGLVAASRQGGRGRYGAILGIAIGAAGIAIGTLLWSAYGL